MEQKDVRKAPEVENEAEVEPETRQELRFASLLHVKITTAKPVANFRKSSRLWRLTWLSRFLLTEEDPFNALE